MINKQTLQQDHSAKNSANYTTLLSSLDLFGNIRSTRFDVGCEEKNGTTGSTINRILDNTLVGYGKTSYINENSSTSMLPKWTTINSVGCDSIIMLNLTVYNTKLSVKVFLEGSYLGNQTMVATLNSPDLGTISLDSTATDSVTINLWSPDSLSNANPSYSISSIIHSNGSIKIMLPLASYNKSYYIAFKHRNSVETWSSIPIQIGESATYDFTTSLSQAFDDDNNPPMKDMGNGVYAIYGGDVNQDGAVDGFDMQPTENDASNFAFGYNATDCNGDGSSDGFDMQIIENNSSLFIYYSRPY